MKAFSLDMFMNNSNTSVCLEPYDFKTTFTYIILCNPYNNPERKVGMLLYLFTDGKTEAQHKWQHRCPKNPSLPVPSLYPKTSYFLGSFNVRR